MPATTIEHELPLLGSESPLGQDVHRIRSIGVVAVGEVVVLLRIALIFGQLDRLLDPTEPAIDVSMCGLRKNDI